MKQLIKFSASWCQPCKALSGNFKYVDMKDVEFKEVDIDENIDMAKQYGVRSVPTMVLLEDGKEVGRKSGVLMADKIEEFIHG
jgi:thioredoxin-like negative regulator of GroEL